MGFPSGLTTSRVLAIERSDTVLAGLDLGVDIFFHFTGIRIAGRP
jgi:hypothetical protein